MRLNKAYTRNLILKMRVKILLSIRNRCYYLRYSIRLSHKFLKNSTDDNRIIDIRGSVFLNKKEFFSDYLLHCWE